MHPMISSAYPVSTFGA